MPDIACDYCHYPAKLVTGMDIYPHRPDLYNREFWLCEPCDAWVGCHSNSNSKPLGRLANAQLRAMKQKAHYYFDQIWRRGLMTRKNAYRWLANELGIEYRKCHIGYFDEIRCAHVARVAKRYLAELQTEIEVDIDGPFRRSQK